MRNVIIYTRVSTDEQASRGYSLRDQEERLRTYCDRNGMRVVDHFQDDHSAKSFNRPAWSKLMQRIEADVAGVDAVLVVKWDRFSRNATDALSMIRRLDEEYGVRVQATEQPIEQVDEVPEQLLMLGFYVTAPEVENRRRSLATKRGMRRAMREGRYVNVPPKGYMRSRDAQDRYLIVPGDDADYVRRAFRMLADGQRSMNAVRKALVAEGFKCSKNQFTLMIRNPLYQGDIVIPAWRGEAEEVVEGVHEALVERTTFAKVQARFEKPGRKRYRNLTEQLPLRGHLLDPRTIGQRDPARLYGSASRSRNGERVWYYHGEGKGCYRVAAKRVHHAFEAMLEDVRLAPEVVALHRALAKEMLHADRQGQVQRARRAREAVEQAEAKLLTVDERYLDGDLEKDSYKRLKDKYRTQVVEARLVINAARDYQAHTAKLLDFTVGLLARLPEVWQAQPLRVRDALVGSIWPDGIYFDGEKTRTTQESEIIALFRGKTQKMKDASLENEAGVLCGSPGRTRTYNPAVNSRMLYH